MDRQEKSIWFWILILSVAMYFLIGTGRCTSVPTKEVVAVTSPAPIPTTIPIKETGPQLKLSWEVGHDERKIWTSSLLNYLNQSFISLDKAQDITRFCPTYAKLTRDQKLQVWGELFVGLSYAESAWRPGDASVDVGTEDDKNSWSVGLFSVSVDDINNYNFKDLHYIYKDLLQPIPNIDLAVRLIAFQIEKVGKINIGPGRTWLYFATLHDEGSYDETLAIVSRVKKLSFCK